MAEVSCNSLTNESSPWWAKLLDRYGIPTVLLAITIFAAWSGVKWVATEVGKPLVTRHIVFVDGVQGQVEKQTDILRELAEVNRGTQKIMLENQIILKDAVDHMGKEDEKKN